MLTSSFFLLFAYFSPAYASLELEPNNEPRDAMLIASGQEIEGKTDDSPADETSDGDPDYYLIEIDADVPTGITLRLKADDCKSCSAVNFVLIDKSEDAILAAENSEQSSTSSEQLIQQEYNIKGSTYVKVFSSGRN